MSKYAVISTDNNPDYYSLIPLVAYSWKQIGYMPVVLMVNVPRDVQDIIIKYCPAGTTFKSIDILSTIKDSTIAQVARLFAFTLFEDDNIVVTGDGDMIVMKDIFTHPGLTSYGYDLTGRSALPICYVKGTVKEWRELMKVEEGAGFGDALLMGMPEAAKSDNWETYWSCDQTLLTNNAKEYGFDRITFIDRGFAGPISANRWDRYCWDRKPDDIIDVHCIRGVGNWDKIVEMAQTLWPSENWSWLNDYKKEFNEML